MAEPSNSESSPDTDRDFDPSADMLVHDFDDEHTLDEEEGLSGDSVGSELDELEKESDMPLEDLLSMYGYGASGAASGPAVEHQETRSSSEEEILSNHDLTLDKDEIARDLLKNVDDKETTVNDLLHSVHVHPHHSQTARLLRSNSQTGSSDDDDDEEGYEYEPKMEEDWKKTIQVGSDYQAPIPQGLSSYGDAPAYENDDRLLWDPSKLSDDRVESYLSALKRVRPPGGVGSTDVDVVDNVQSLPGGTHIRDDEQALYLLLQCGHNAEEALRRRKMQTVPMSDPMSLWSEEECRNFELGLRLYGKEFYLIQQNKVRTRSVGELVQFYYLWKKTERHDVFANEYRLEKKKYALHPGVTDYMDRFLDDQENPTPSPRDRSASPVNCLLYNDPKRLIKHEPVRHENDLPIITSATPTLAEDNHKTVLHASCSGHVTPVSLPALRPSVQNVVHIASVTVDRSDGGLGQKRLKLEPDHVTTCPNHTNTIEGALSAMNSLDDRNNLSAVRSEPHPAQSIAQ